MTPEDQKQLLTAINQFVREEVDKATEPLRELIAELRKGLDDFGYVGDWGDGIVYRKGNFCSLSGSMWFCCADATQERPSTSARDWMLAVKRGRDGRDGNRSPTAARTLHANS